MPELKKHVCVCVVWCVCVRACVCVRVCTCVCVCVFAYLELCSAPTIYFVAKFEAVQDINSTLVDMNSVSCKNRDSKTIKKNIVNEYYNKKCYKLNNT